MKLSILVRASCSGLLGLLLPAFVQAAERAPHVAAALVSENRVLAPGINTLSVTLTPEPGWHTYWRNPGDAGQATTLQWMLPDGYTAGAIQWPTPQIFRSDNLTNIGYDSRTPHLVDIQVPATAHGEVELRVLARWLACSDVCVPEQAQLSLRRRVETSAISDESLRSAFAAARARLPRPDSGSSSYRIANGALTLRKEGKPVSVNTRGLQFFSYQEGLLDYAQPARVSVKGDALIIEQAMAAEAEPQTGMLEGIVLSTEDSSTAWELRAQVAAAPLAGTATEPPSQSSAPTPELSYALVLLLAFAGGLILNLMPCVFPVLSIKAVSLMQGASKSTVQRRHAMIYTAGVVLSCVGAAALLLILRAGGQALGWGFQLQSPFFVGVLAYLMFVMALSLSGALHIGMGLMGTGQGLASREGYAGSFFTGVLAVIVASPCTAPFMGTALGYAITQPWPQALSVFAMLGVGLASPFLLIAWWPALARLLPRPGLWMETFKQAMAFPLYFTVVWLLWVIGRQAGIAALIAALTGLVLIAICSWSLSRSTWMRRVLAPLSAIVAIGLLTLPVQSPPQAVAGIAAEKWEPYSDQRLAQLRDAGTPVFIDLTADWCITCKINERIALDTEATQAAFSRRGVVLLRGDWTRSDPRITQVLERFGRNGVPLYVFFAPHAPAQVLPQLLTQDIIIDSLKQNRS